MGSFAALLTAAAPEPERVRRMLCAVPHRGKEICLAERGCACLGTVTGEGVGVAELHAGERLLASFCGYLDDAADLGTRLGLPDQVNRPAALVAAAFEAWGLDAPARLRGSFTAAVTDGVRLYCWRDHVGFGSAVFRSAGGETLVATEPKQILAGAGLSREPDLEVIEGIFYARMRGDHRCAVRGVERLPAAMVLQASPSSTRLSRYWRPENLLEGDGIHPGEIRECFEERMERAVRRAMHGNDAVSLSGGVDSPAIAAFAAPIHLARTGNRLPGLTATYAGHPRVDETRYVEIITKALGMSGHQYPARARATDQLERWVDLVDGPIPVVSVAETVEHLAQARQRGFRNLLGGEFAEFVFDMRFDIEPHLVARGRWRAALKYMSAQAAQGTSTRTLARRTIGAVLPDFLLTSLHNRRPAARNLPPWISADRLQPVSFVPARDRWRKAQLAPIGQNLCLEVDEVLQSVCGVSQRQPWADVDLWEFFIGLPAEIKFPAPGSKRLIRQWLRGRLPDVILDRKDKTVFDSYIASTIDYDTLMGWLRKTDYRMPGIDYATLNARLERRDLNLLEFMWAKDLAGVHAFLSVC